MQTMTDKELIELAAKAAGIGELVWGEVWNVGGDLVDCSDMPYIRSQQPDEGDCYWNPLTDDGDALRLAVKLNIDVEVFRDKTSTWVVIGCGYFETEEEHNGDSYAATRRAIVRAAAEIGKAST